MTFDQSVYEYVKSVPRGKVTTYGMIARAIGHPRAARQVGNALHRNPAPGIVPCHRVVNREGRLAPAFAFGGIEVQARLLEEEGVTVKDGYVEMERYFWKG
ncbi:MAG: MGMT family protein [Clostridia bacterium]|jgi:methylated-DNA-protein-cysteine methyltransferase-like protein|nr:MGMT family protein [Clostridia bacterium]